MRFPARLLVSALTLTLLAVGLPTALPFFGAAPAAAADKADFNPGLIVSDAVFYDAGSMSEGEIATFIANKGASCAPGEAKCLKDYTENTGTWSAEAGLCTGYSGATNESSARIISKVARACGISPKTLLVLLEKEQSLVTRTRPTTRAYTAATGFGCPDTAPCDARYAGFATQVYGAARQFKRYAATPTKWGYQAGRSNNILWNPNVTCGSSSVYIQNQATAALYIYTPYRPNAAALNNLYGTGDSCSSYGNRNFWRIFSDWFGQPDVGSFLVRTSSDPNVYLVSGTTKRLVKDMATLDALSALGPVGYVSASYLSTKTTGAAMTRIVRNTKDGSLYLLDGGTKYHFTSCSMVAAWGGGNCATYSDLSPDQLAMFSENVAVTQLVSTTSGKFFYVTGGKKREIFDTPSLTAAGITGTTITMKESAVSSLATAAPIVRDDVVIKRRGTNAWWLVQGGKRALLSASLRTDSPLGKLPTKDLDIASIQAMSSSTTLTGLFTDKAGTRYVATTTGLTPIASTTAFAAKATQLSDKLVSTLTVEPAYEGTVFARHPGSSTVYAISNDNRRPISSWSDLVFLAGTGNPRILLLPVATLDSTVDRGAPLPIGKLVRSAANPDLYLIDGLDRKVRIESFTDSDEIGAKGYSIVPASSLDGYAAAPAALSPILTCGTASYAGVGGTLVQRKPAAADPAALPVTALDPLTCRSLTVAGGAVSTGQVYLKGWSQATVYAVSATQKHPVDNWDALLRHNAGHGNPLIVIIGGAALNRIPTGSTIR